MSDMISLSTTPRARMRVMEILGNAVVGGMESYVLRLIRALPRDAWDVICLCPYESSITHELRNAGCTVYITPIRDDPQWHSVHFAATLVREHHIQVIHAHLSNAHVLGALVSGITGVPCLVTIHGRSLPIMDLEICRTCKTHVTVVTESAYWHALSLGINPDHVQFIPNGIDTETFRNSSRPSAWRELLGVKTDQVLIGQVGRLAPEKGPELFLRSAWIVHRHCADARFVLVGEGPLRAELESLVCELKLEGIVQLVGVQFDMHHIYPALDLLVLGSHSEGMPFALLEGMACAIPVVATNVGGVCEVVESEKTGLLAIPGDPESIAHGVLQLIKAPERRRAMGVQARQRMVERFSFSQSAEKMVNLLASLAKQVEKESTVVGIDRVVTRSTGHSMRGRSALITPLGRDEK